MVGDDAAGGAVEVVVVRGGREIEWHVVVAGGGEGGVEVVGAREGDGVVAVLALVGGDDDGGVVGGPLHPLLHRALAVGAPVVAPAAGTQWYIIHNLTFRVQFSEIQMQMHVSSAVPFNYIVAICLPAF